MATIGRVIAVGAALVAVRRRWMAQDTASFGFGVLLAMIGILIAIGAGTIFPIVIVFGGSIVGLAIGFGTAIGYAFGWLTSKWSRRS